MCVIKPILILLLTSGLSYGAQDTGFPAGLMAECPGMFKNVTFSNETRESLHVVVVWPTTNWLDTLRAKNEVKCKLSAEGVDCVAKHVDLKKEKVLVLISGYLDASFSPLTRFIVTSYLDSGRVVIIMECFPLLVRTYPVAARVAKPLGFILGEFLANLTRRGLSPQRISILGGSLGAHIGSYAATKYHELTNWKPYRLTGLDPAGPCFRNLPAWDRFNALAAYRVDALHTNIDGFGIADAIAQVDFYANGGEYQTKTKGNFLLPCFALCSHLRSVSYWYLSIVNPQNFLAVRCDSVAHARHGDCYDGKVVSNALGPETNFSRPGVYYLPTTDESPYYLENKGLTKRKYGVNNYLLKLAKDEDLVI